MIINLYNQGFISGIDVTVESGEEVPVFGNIQITPKGIEYLQNNGLLKKAERFMKTVKNTVPGI